MLQANDLLNSDTPKYLHSFEMSLQCPHDVTMRWSAEPTVSNREQCPQFSNHFQKGWYLLTSLSDPPSLLRPISTGSETRDQRSGKNNRKCKSALYMAAVTASSVNSGPSSFSLNTTVTLQEEKYNSVEVLRSAVHLRAAFLFVYIFDSEYSAKAQHQARSVQELDVRLMQQLERMLHQGNLYVWTFRSFIE